VGAGPAGLEAARALGQRGYDVMLADSRRELGGRVTRESQLPGLITWARVRDWRLGQIRRMSNIQLLPENAITSDIARESSASLIAVATGATWRRDGIGRYYSTPIPGLDQLPVYTPDDIMDGNLPSGHIVVFDDDHFYMGGVIAELLIARGCRVHFVTPESLASSFTQYTMEQKPLQRRLMESCASVSLMTTIARLEAGCVHLRCTYTERESIRAADAVVLVTGMTPRDELYVQLQSLGEKALRDAGIRRVSRLGDCLGPGIIAAAVHSGHLFSRELDTSLTDDVPYRRENVELGWGQELPGPRTE